MTEDDTQQITSEGGEFYIGEESILECKFQKEANDPHSTYGKNWTSNPNALKKWIIRNCCIEDHKELDLNDKTLNKRCDVFGQYLDFLEILEQEEAKIPHYKLALKFGVSPTYFYNLRENSTDNLTVIKELFSCSENIQSLAPLMLTEIGKIEEQLGKLVKVKYYSTKEKIEKLEEFDALRNGCMSVNEAADEIGTSLSILYVWMGKLKNKSTALKEIQAVYYIKYKYKNFCSELKNEKLEFAGQDFLKNWILKIQAREYFKISRKNSKEKLSLSNEMAQALKLYLSLLEKSNQKSITYNELRRSAPFMFKALNQNKLSTWISPLKNNLENMIEHFNRGVNQSEYKSLEETHQHWLIDALNICRKIKQQFDKVQTQKKILMLKRPDQFFNRPSSLRSKRCEVVNTRAKSDFFIQQNPDAFNYDDMPHDMPQPKKKHHR